MEGEIITRQDSNYMSIKFLQQWSLMMKQNGCSFTCLLKCPDFRMERVLGFCGLKRVTSLIY